MQLEPRGNGCNGNFKNNSSNILRTRGKGKGKGSRGPSHQHHKLE